MDSGSDVVLRPSEARRISAAVQRERFKAAILEVNRILRSGLLGPRFERALQNERIRLERLVLNPSTHPDGELFSRTGRIKIRTRVKLIRKLVSQGQLDPRFSRQLLRQQFDLESLLSRK
jgi:hypothetical protein